MKRNAIRQTPLKRKLLKMLDKQLTLCYVNDYLRCKGIATLEHDDRSLTFKLYDLDWFLSCENGKFSIQCFLVIRDDTLMESMASAMNTLNKERFVVKAYLDEAPGKDGEGAPVKDTQTAKGIVISFENICYTESSFPDLYETAIYFLTDAIDGLKNLYREYRNKQDSFDNRTKIGFYNSSSQQDTGPAGMSRQERRRIGFSLM